MVQKDQLHIRQDSCQLQKRIMHSWNWRPCPWCLELRNSINFFMEEMLVTDHKPLTTIFGSKTGVPPIAAARLQRWVLLLSAYSYTIVYKPGVNHNNVDGLSHLPLSQVKPSTFEAQSTDFPVCQLNLLPVTAKQLAKMRH